MPLPLQLHDRRRRPDRRRSEPHPISSDLARALTEDEVELLFQPQYSAQTNAIVGAEALVRWSHSIHGPLAGDAVVAIAQAGGAARRLARYIARAAFHAAARWPMDCRLSINVTAMDLFDRTFAEDLLSMLHDANMPPERLTLEITEQALVADLDKSARRLSALAETGIRIALDDFGAGYCNFRYLKLLPLNALKLDKAMVDGVTNDARDLAVLRGIVAMARALDLDVIAEGVETQELRDVIAREGCAMWQGFLGAKAMPAEDFAALL